MRDDEKLEFARHLRRNMTPSERLLWWKLRGKQQDGWKFHSQKAVGPFIIDFACIEIQLAIEVDGATHSTAAERDYDARRSRWLEGNGWRMVRFSNAEVKSNLLGVVDTIHVAAAEQAEWIKHNPTAKPKHRR